MRGLFLKRLQHYVNLKLEHCEQIVIKVSPPTFLLELACTHFSAQALLGHELGRMAFSLLTGPGLKASRVLRLRQRVGKS